MAWSAAERSEHVEPSTAFADAGGPALGPVVAAGILVAFWIAAGLLVDPRADVPLIDDWVYASSVERLLLGEGLKVASWSSTFPPAQIAWGTLFAACGGFSYTALRLSTLTVALLGTLAFHAGLRALGCGAVPALIGALTLAVYPVAFVLSFTFMTDVPMLAAMLASLWALARGLGTQRDTPPDVGWVALGLAFALVAFLVRPVAMAIPAAVLLTATLRRDPRRRAPVVALALATLAAMAVSTMVAGHWRVPAAGGPDSVAFRLERLRYIVLVPPAVYAEALLSMLAHLGLAAVPVLLIIAPARRQAPWRTAAGLVLAAIAVSWVAPESVAALKPHATWSTEELGGARPLLRGYVAYGGIRLMLGMLATLTGLMAASVLVVRIVRSCRSGGALRTPAGTCIGLFGALSLGFCFVLWFFYDRYYLPLVPVVIAAALLTAPPQHGETYAGSVAARAGGGPRRTWAAGTLLAALFVLDVTGTRDMLAFARAVDAALARLVATGVAWREIDGGYVENGWHLYAHPENLPPGAQIDRDVVHVTGWTELPYAIANVPLPGYVVRETVPVPQLWATTDHVYILAQDLRADAGAGGG